MASFKELIVTGITRLGSKVFATEFIGKLTGNADTATKATQDESGNNIKASYGASLEVDGSTIKLKNKNNGELNKVTIPAATTSANGLMSKEDKVKMNDIPDKSIPYIDDEDSEIGNAMSINADTLGGQNPSYYAKSADLNKLSAMGDRLTTSILEKALTLPEGFHNFSFDGSAYTGGDLAANNHAYGSVSVLKRASNAILVILWGEANTTIASNWYNGIQWGGWKRYLTTNGDGTITANRYTPIILNNTTGANGCALGFQANGENLGFISIQNGVLHLLDKTGNSGCRIITADNIGDYALPLQAGQGYPLRRPLVMNPGVNTAHTAISKNQTSATDYGTYIEDFDSEGNFAKLILNATDSAKVGAEYTCRLVTPDGNAHVVYGGHVKPTGTYTGNGSATERTIKVGGVGKVLCVGSGQTISFINPYGCTTFGNGNNSTQYYNNGVVSFNSGILKIASSNTGINGSGTVFTYWVI